MPKRSKGFKREREPLGEHGEVDGPDIYKARFTKRNPRPPCLTKCIEKQKEFKAAYYEFKAQFQEASVTLSEALPPRLENFNVCSAEGGVPLFGGCFFE